MCKALFGVSERVRSVSHGLKRVLRVISDVGTPVCGSTISVMFPVWAPLRGKAKIAGRGMGSRFRGWKNGRRDAEND